MEKISENNNNHSVSRYKKWRNEKRKKGPDFKNNEKERVKQWRKRKTEAMTQEEIQKRKKYEKEKKRVQRAKKLIQTQDREAGSNIVGDCESECFPYKCKQTYAKAVQKCMRSLPSSPTKKRLL